MVRNLKDKIQISIFVKKINNYEMIKDVKEGEYFEKKIILYIFNYYYFSIFLT